MNKSLKTVLIIGSIVIGVIVILSVVPGLIWGWQGYGGMMGPGMMGGLRYYVFDASSMDSRDRVNCLGCGSSRPQTHGY